MRFMMPPYPLKRLPRILGKPFRKALARPLVWPLAVLDMDVLASFQIVIAFLFWERSQERVLDRVMLVIFGILTSLPGFSRAGGQHARGKSVWLLWWLLSWQQTWVRCQVLISHLISQPGQWLLLELVMWLLLAHLDIPRGTAKSHSMRPHFFFFFFLEDLSLRVWFTVVSML